MFVAKGHTVLIEKGAGEGAAFTDEEYAAAGAELVDTGAEVYARADMVIKVKEPEECEYKYFREGQILYTYLHLASCPELAFELMKKGVSVFQDNLIEVHVSGHGCQEELKLMHALTKPKYFVPVHGEYFMLRKHVTLATSCGIPKENCFVLAPGDVLNINTKGATVIKEGVPASDIYLDSSLSDVDSNVLKERRKMAAEGLVSITYFINKKKQILNKPIVTLNGFATPDKASELEEKISNKCEEIYNNMINENPGITYSNLERQISNQVNHYIYNKMDRRPLIVVSIKKAR